MCVVIFERAAVSLEKEFIKKNALVFLLPMIWRNSFHISPLFFHWLWQEAYKAIEDIHNLMNMSKKTPVAKTMANYYGKLALVFWKAGHCLFHAAALLKLFQLSREMKKNITQEELQK